MEGTKAKPLYKVIYEQLKEQIEQNRYGPGEQLPTEVELAKMFQVSLITSKRALLELQRDGLIYRTRGKGSFVKSMSPAESRGPVVRSVENTANIVSMVLPSQGHGFARYIQGAADYLNKCGYYLSVHSTDDAVASDRQFLRDLASKGIRGIIYYPVNHFRNWDVLLALRMNQCAVVTIDQHLPDLPIPSVVCDNFGGSYESAKRLIELGHRRIAYVSCTYIDSTSTIRERFYGYCSALRESGIAVDPDVLVFDYTMGPSDAVGGRSSGRSVLTRLKSLNVTAILAEHDFLACELLSRAAELGMKVPQDLSIVGFDNLEIGAHLPIPLTTVEQDFYEIGRKAAELVIELMERGANFAFKKHVVPVKLIERNTTGPASD
ncbi:MAG: GntR family transcriptional regulator [Alicyclobacillus sp.]|nr:GntR family transcriptional regulator [Alicyclobacillus sp.]